MHQLVPCTTANVRDRAARRDSRSSSGLLVGQCGVPPSSGAGELCTAAGAQMPLKMHRPCIGRRMPGLGARIAAERSSGLDFACRNRGLGAPPWSGGAEKRKATWGPLFALAEVPSPGQFRFSTMPGSPHRCREAQISRILSPPGGGLSRSEYRAIQGLLGRNGTSGTIQNLMRDYGCNGVAGLDMQGENSPEQLPVGSWGPPPLVWKCGTERRRQAR